jgi:hypothetical protein
MVYNRPPNEFPWVLTLRNRGELALAVVFASFWIWLALVSAYPIDTRGAAGETTTPVWILYVAVVPLLLLLVVVTAVVAMVGRLCSIPRGMADIAAAIMVATLWALSFSARFWFLVIVRVKRPYSNWNRRRALP